MTITTGYFGLSPEQRQFKPLLGKQVNAERTSSLVQRCYRTDLYREAAEEVGVAVPTINYKTEGNHTKPWTLKEATKPIPMGPDAFFDGIKFDPSKPVEYLKQFPMNNMKVPMADLKKLNK